jgi:hypothetical protein
MILTKILTLQRALGWLGPKAANYTGTQMVKGPGSDGLTDLATHPLEWKFGPSRDQGR